MTEGLGLSLEIVQRRSRWVWVRNAMWSLSLQQVALVLTRTRHTCTIGRVGPE